MERRKGKGHDIHRKKKYRMHKLETIKKKEETQLEYFERSFRSRLKTHSLSSVSFGDFRSPLILRQPDNIIKSMLVSVLVH